MAETCMVCQQTVDVGDWPWCPHGRPNLGVIDDQLEGGPRRFDTMGDDEPYIETKSQWRREVAARGLVHVDRHDRDYYRKLFKAHDERLKDTGTA